MIPEGTENHNLDSKSDAENEWDKSRLAKRLASTDKEYIERFHEKIITTKESILMKISGLELSTINSHYKWVLAAMTEWEQITSAPLLKEIESDQARIKELEEQLKEAIDNCNKLGGMVSEAYEKINKLSKPVTKQP